MPTSPVTRARGKLALDAAGRRHREILREKCLADLPVAIGPACTAAQGAVFLAEAEVVRRDKAAFPETELSIPGARFVVQEAAFCRGLEIHRKALLDKLLVQAHRLAFDRAKADVPFAEILVGSEIIAVNRASADQPGELIARIDPAAPGVGVIVDAHLVELGRIDAVEPVGHLAKLNGMAVADHGACCPSGTCG